MAIRRAQTELVNASDTTPYGGQNDAKKNEVSHDECC